jgi:hypothetical protein
VVLSVRIRHRKSECTGFLPHTCHIPSPSHPPPFGYPDDIFLKPFGMQVTFTDKISLYLLFICCLLHLLCSYNLLINSHKQCQFEDGVSCPAL